MAGVELSEFLSHVSASGPWCTRADVYTEKHLHKRISMLGLGHSSVKWILNLDVCYNVYVNQTLGSPATLILGFEVMTSR